MADKVSQFPKIYTSYQVCYILFKDTPKVYLTLQCPFDKLDDALLAIMQMPQEECYFFEVHGHLPDGKVDVIRGDITATDPRGSITVRHTSIVFPGGSLIKEIGKSSSRVIADHATKVIKDAESRRIAEKVSVTRAPAVIPEAKEVKAIVDAALDKAASTPTGPNVNDFKVVRTVSVYIEEFK